jgi:dihydrofolate reductase
MEIIAALSDNNAIGLNNDLLWHIPEDMRHFKELTTGNTVIMGRKTWESLPTKFRPLPNRYNIVISRNPNYVAQGAAVFSSLTDAIAESEGKIFVIGGGQIYEEALQHASVLHLTRVHTNIHADTFFPSINFDEWKLESIIPHENSQYRFSFLTLVRK